MQNYQKNKKNSVALPKEVSITVTRPFTILKKKKKKNHTENKDLYVQRKRNIVTLGNA